MFDYRQFSDEIYQFATQMFKSKVESRDVYDSPYGAEFRVHIYKPFNFIDISIYESNINMHIGNYIWEFDDNISSANIEMKKYLRAAYEHKLVEKTTTIGPFKVNKTIEIKP